MLPFCHFLSYESNRKKSFTKVIFDIFYMIIAICYMKTVTRYYLQKLVPFARCCMSRNFFMVFLILVLGTLVSRTRQKSFQSLEWVQFCKTCFFTLRIYFWSKLYFVQFLAKIQIWRHIKLPQNDKFVLPELWSVSSADRIFSRG